MKYIRLNFKINVYHLHEKKSTTERHKRRLGQIKNILCSWIEITSIIKMPILPKLICKFNLIPISVTIKILKF